MTKINYADKAWPIVTGCTPVGRGCRECWAKRLAEGRLKRFYPDGFGKVTVHPEKLGEPLHWRKPRRVFVAPMGDLFHEEVSREFMDQVFARMRAARQHTFLILTKRPDLMRRYVGPADGETSMRVRHLFPPQLPKHWYHADNWRWPLPNVWLGVSIEDQAAADERIPLVLETPAAHRWVSYEPVLGPAYLLQYTSPQMRKANIDCLVIGGESGPSFRPMELEWLESAVAQCDASGVPVWVKQDSGRYPGRQGRIPDQLWARKEWPK